MKAFEYGDRLASGKEMAFAILAMVPASGMLTFPRVLAGKVPFFDGWMALLATGLIMLLFVAVIVRLTARFPQQTFLSYTSSIVGRPLAWLLTCAAALHFSMIVCYQTRAVAEMSSLYLFDKTPREAVGLAFLLVVIYAVLGQRIALLRINILFTPLVIGALMLVALTNVGFVELGNLRPVLVLDGKQLAQGMKESLSFFLGFENLLFYMVLAKQPGKVMKSALTGFCILIVVYVTIYFFVIGVFTNAVAQTLVNPTVELAKEIEMPGEFFERFESIFFSIWIMTMFTTAAMALDIAVGALHSVWTAVRERTWLLIVAPIIMWLAMQPRNLLDVVFLDRMLTVSGAALALVVPCLLLLIAKARRLGNDE